jgi:hypothetical protein
MLVRDQELLDGIIMKRDMDNFLNNRSAISVLVKTGQK